MSLINENEINNLVKDAALEWLNSSSNQIKEKFKSIDSYVDDIKYRLDRMEHKIQADFKKDIEISKNKIEKRINRYTVGIAAFTIILTSGITGSILFDSIKKTHESTIHLYDRLDSFNNKVEESKTRLQTSLLNIENKSKELDSLNTVYREKTEQLNTLIKATSLQLGKIELERQRYTNNP